MSSNNQYIEVFLKEQKLYLHEGDKLIEEFYISTAINGAGEKMHRECTPRGMHKIYEKTGYGCKPGTVFVARQPTGEIYNSELQKAYPERDWVLTRILQLTGEQEGINKGGEVDTLERMIYIHGSPDNVELGVPGSHGCIRMRNEDVIKLFDKIDVGTIIHIND